MLVWLWIACQQQEAPPLKEIAMTKPPPVEEDIEKLQKEGREIIRRFGNQLKPKLKAAMQAGGPVNAIEVCAEQAPKIAEQLSIDTGWTVKRVSLKNRNPQAKPDVWEHSVLEQWSAEYTASHPKTPPMAFEKVDRQFRMMKAQNIEAVCLHCHGQNIAPDVAKTLEEKYPADLAMGYQVGELRGAFSVSKSLK